MKKDKGVVFFKSSLLVFAMVMSAGCGAMQMQNEKRFNAFIAEGNYKSACEIALKDIPEPKTDTDEKEIKLDLGLKAVTCLMGQQKHQETVDLLDRVETTMKKQDEEILAAKAVQNIGAVLVNDNVLPYVRTEYDGIMLNTYKATSFMSLGDYSSARVEFNRALDRQRRAREYFNAQIKKTQEEIEERKKKEEEELEKLTSNSEEVPMNSKSIMDHADFKNELAKRYSNLDSFMVYPDFVNPYTTYLAGLFFMLDGDMRKARELLKEAYAMNPENPAVTADFKAVENIFTKAGKSPQNTVWVIFENGLSAHKENWEMNLPLFLGQATNVGVLQQIGKVGMLTMALPELEVRSEATAHLIVLNGASEIGKTQPYASMDGVIAAEFKKQYPYIVARAVTSSVTKAVIQYIASDKGGTVGTIVGSLYALSTNRADTRIWEGLPKTFDIARFSRPEDGVVRISDAEGNVVIPSIHLPKGNTVIFIKKTTPISQGVAHVASFVQ